MGSGQILKQVQTCKKVSKIHIYHSMFVEVFEKKSK